MYTKIHNVNSNVLIFHVKSVHGWAYAYVVYLHDQKLEQIIVVTLKNKGMKRDHVCFRKCYNRLFNLSKSFLKV